MKTSSPAQALSRKQWQEASHFHPLSEPQVLELVINRAQSLKGPQKGLVLLDLDSTLYEVGPRTLQIIQDWLSSPSCPSLPADLKTALETLKSPQVGYSLKDTFANLGFPAVSQELESLVQDLKSFWWDRFFSSHYLPCDRPYAGAVEYANHLFELGAEICYLTGRSEMRMRQGTEANLIRDGFPFQPERTSLLMRTNDEWSDALHKSHQISQLLPKGPLLASFENEPVNLVAMAKLAPEAAHIFVDTICSEHAAEPGKNLYTIKGFSSFSAPIS